MIPRVKRQIRLVGFSLIVMLSAVVSANEATSEAFKPYSLVGNWHFTNANTGVKFGGDMKVQINTIDNSGVMRGQLSLDGRQTNDNCGTMGAFSDEPVEVEVTKAKGEYQMSFRLKCSKGESPRTYNWTFACDGVSCVRPTVLPHGKGAATLQEKR